MEGAHALRPEPAARSAGSAPGGLEEKVAVIRPQGIGVERAGIGPGHLPLVGQEHLEVRRR
jgi:hypothetical protein